MSFVQFEQEENTSQRKDVTPDFVERFKKQNIPYKMFNAIGTITFLAGMVLIVYNIIEFDLLKDRSPLNLLEAIVATLPIFWLVFLHRWCELGAAMCMHRGIKKANPPLARIMKFFDMGDGTYMTGQSGHVGAVWQHLLFTYDPLGARLCVAQYMLRCFDDIVTLAFFVPFFKKVSSDLVSLVAFENSGVQLRELLQAQDILDLFVLFFVIFVFADLILIVWRQSRQKKFLNRWKQSSQKDNA